MVFVVVLVSNQLKLKTLWHLHPKAKTQSKRK
jgi:hypothetical protein